MESRVAGTLNYIAQEEFDIFAESDRHTLMDLLQDYFCTETADDPDSGKPNPYTHYKCVQKVTNILITDNEEEEYYMDTGMDTGKASTTDLSFAGADDGEEGDQPLIDDYSSMMADAATMMTSPPTETPLTETPLTETPLTETPPTETPSARTLKEIPANEASHQQTAEALDTFLAVGCGCNRAGGQPCSTLFDKAHYEQIRLSCEDLSRSELDLVLLGQIMAGVTDTPQTRRHGSHQRKLSSMAFFHHGHRICGKTFRMLHEVGMFFVISGIDTSNDYFYISPRDRTLQSCESQLYCLWPYSQTAWQC